MTKTNFTKVYSTPACEEMTLNIESSILTISDGNPNPDVVNDSENWR